MARIARKNGQAARAAAVSKYDAHHTVLDKTYGALADLRRELADSKAAVAERAELLRAFSHCADSQRSWLLLEDYFEKLSLARKDFSSCDWWPRLLAARGNERLEETALLFLRSHRSLPPELQPYANFERFARLAEAEKERQIIQDLEHWILPPKSLHLDAPRASIRAVCNVARQEDNSPLWKLEVQLSLFRPRSGEKIRPLSEIVELTSRSAHEQELFAPEDWDFIVWLSQTHPAPEPAETISLHGLKLLEWLARWGHSQRLLLAPSGEPLQFFGQLAQLTPQLENLQDDLHFTHTLTLPDASTLPLSGVRFFAGHPVAVLAGQVFYLLRNPPPPKLFSGWLEQPRLPVSKLSHRLLTQLRTNGEDWAKLCVAHSAVPQFVFELNDDTVRLRLLAKSLRDETLWQWNGHEWQRLEPRQTEKPELLDDARLEAAVQWLRRLDWFTPEAGLWVGDANENFLATLAEAWPDRPEQAEYLGNPGFHRLFLAPRQLHPRLVIQGSGIDWFAVSAQWEAEGLKLTPADLAQLRSATSRFVKLPDSGWMELDLAAVQSAHEAMADFGVDGLSPAAQRVRLMFPGQIEEKTLAHFSEQPEFKALRQAVDEFRGIPSAPLPQRVQAELRPYQKDGFEFLCHLSRMKLGGVLADDMGLGKTLQTLVWLAWLEETSGAPNRPALVICPASVLHNWRREANRFAPHFKVLVLESGAARHNLRKQIPANDLIVTNYALLRRDLAALQKFEFRAIILDEAQFIKNPSAQVTQSVKKLRADLRLALTGTPLENRLLDLWSIVDFVQPGYLGSQHDFSAAYEPRGDHAEWSHKIARRRLSAKLRPLLLRRLKKQVAQDLPDRIEERRDCELTDPQRKLYLAELRRSREQVMKTVSERGLAKSKIHVLAALTRLRQICCHPRLVGNDSRSGKTDTLFELLEPLLEEGQKVLLFSQFVEMLLLLESECRQRQIPTFILTGQTKQRHTVVNDFQRESRASVFLLSLRAAGTGLNLTTASYVVLYDPWWNPAVEAQAIDRSHRIGQSHTVNAYRLIAPGTVEEKIWELQQRKAQTIVDVLGEEGFARHLSKTDLEYLFSEE